MPHPSFDVPIAVAILSRNDGRVRFTEQIGYRGVCLRTDSPPPVNQLVRMRFTLPLREGGTQSVVLNGVVTRIVPPSGMLTAGVEIAFFAKGGEDARHWDSFIEETRRTSVPPASCERIVVGAPAIPGRLTA